MKKEAKAISPTWELLGDECPESVVDAFRDLYAQHNAALKPADDPVYQSLQTIAVHINAQRDRIDGLLEPLQFDYAEGRPLMVVKLGCAHNGWVPGPKQFDIARRTLKAAGVDKKKNILLYHYGIQIEQHDA